MNNNGTFNVTNHSPNVRNPYIRDKAQDTSCMTPNTHNLNLLQKQQSIIPDESVTNLQIQPSTTFNESPTAFFNHITTVQTGPNQQHTRFENNTFKFNASPYLDNVVKSPNLSLAIPQNLEPLRSLIMLQHESFTQSILDLGDINLTLTSTIEKKVDSFHQLKFNNKIPRSLQIKCKLTASPPYSSNFQFIKLKKAMDDALASFIKKGTEIMTDWIQVNINLLLEDRCSCILTKALPILDCLTAFHAEIYGAPHWQSVNRNDLTLFLLKLYFSNIYIEISDIINYFNITAKSILPTGAK